MYWLAIPIGLVTAFLGSWGGAEGTSKGFRRFGIPCILTGVAFLFIRDWWVLSTLSLIGVLSLGYGENSHIRRWWKGCLNEENGDDKKANILTRTTIGFLEGFCFISIPILTGLWVHYFVFLVSIMAIETLFGAIIEHEGMVKLFGKDLLLEEAYRYGLLGILLTVLIYIGSKREK